MFTSFALVIECAAIGLEFDAAPQRVSMVGGLPPNKTLHRTFDPLPTCAFAKTAVSLIAIPSFAAGGEVKMSGVARQTDKVIHLSVLLTASPARAFHCFTNPALLTQWLTGAAEVEEHVGGKYELFWQPDDRENNSTIGCKITAFEVGQLLAFQWKSPAQFQSFANVADPLTHVVVTFAPESSATRVHLIHSGWRSSSEWDAARTWQENAWRGAFEELERLVSS